MKKYLRAIYQLTEGGEDATKTSEVADKLNVSDASVSEAVTKLQDKGFVCKADYKGFTLSPMGKKKGKEIQKIFEKTETFLEDKKVENVEDEAESLLNSVSEETLEKIISE